MESDSRKKTKKNKNYSGWILAFVCFGVLVWHYQNNLDVKVPAPPAFEITAIQLMNEYSENEIAADLKFKDMIVVVSGKVTDRSKDILNHIYVALYAGKTFTCVQCFFNDRYAREIAAERSCG